METAHVDTFARDHLPPRAQWPDLLFTLPELDYAERMNAAVELLDGRFDERPCIHGDDETWTYAELRDRAERIAGVLVDDMGLVPGNRVLLHGPNTRDLLACWFGIVLAGGVVVATMPLLRERELSKVIAKAEVSHGLVDARVAGEAVSAQAEQPVLRELLTFGPGGELEERAAAKPAGFEAVETHAEDVALIAFTSGTAGEPKGCVHMHRDLLSLIHI